MKRILLIDADSTIPNIAIGKLSTYHKNKGDQVDYTQLKLPYYSHLTKKTVQVNGWEYDKIYCSVIFQGNKQYINSQSDIIFGGTGSGDIKKTLPDEIEYLEVDYSLWPDNEFSYGFITRGCIRKCYFCYVPIKEGGIRFNQKIDDIVRHDKTKFFDNNILSYDKHLDILQELADKKIKCCFNQGLDIRLLNKDNSELLKQINNFEKYVFAFDDIKSMKIIESKLDLIPDKKDWMTKFFIYCHPGMNMFEIAERVSWCKDRKFLPFIMLDKSCYFDKNKSLYKAVKNWCNYPLSFCNTKKDFSVFINEKCPNIDKSKLNSFLNLFKSYGL